ncbi:MAG TPA: prenyltransferase/squalene oxidase repeat-containing protein [Phycisphaerae bacterium]|nr:prenyltransferase/squalene oxidase repeat-containing protein [Phycisphaerae bacterium]
MRSGRIIQAATALALLAAVSVQAPATRAQLDDEDGGAVPRKVETAVDSGLEFLAKSQQPDGRWGTQTPAASTGLAVMAFMARGHVPGQGPYGENLNKGIEAILRLQTGDGYFGTGGQSGMYQHGICTVALCETYGMVDETMQPRVRTAISKAVRLILNAQSIRKSPNDQGGWRYSPDTNQSDTSVSGWQLMALRGASNAGANIPENAIKDGINYIKGRAVFGGGFGYTNNQGANPALTGTGVLALSLMGQPNMPEVRQGGDFLLNNIAQIGAGGVHYYYTMYYCSQAAWQLGGKYWSVINKQIMDSLLPRQRPNGSWPAGESDETYATAMSILALSVPYRYLPIYQR